MRRSLSCPPTRASIAAGALLAAASSITPHAQAADRFWTNPAGGLFGDAANWDDGVGGVPGVADVARLEIEGLFAIAVEASRTTDRLVARRGVVTLDLASGVTYTLLRPDLLAPGIVVGEQTGDVVDLDVRGGGVHAAYAVIAKPAGTAAALRVRGPDGRLDVEQQILVGDGGFGLLDLCGGATITCGVGVAGRAAGSLGSVLVADDSTRWELSGTLTIGKFGAGEMELRNGATVRCAAAVIAQNDGATGAVDLRDAKTSWIIDGPLDVGMRSAGTLVISGGARVTCTDFATIGTQPAASPGDSDTGGVGAVTVLGPGSSFSVRGGFLDGDLYVGLLNVGTLHVGSGGTVSIDGCLTVNDNSAEPDHEPLVVSLTGGDDYGQAAIAIGGGFIAGTGPPRLDVRLEDGFAPGAGDTFLLMTAHDGLADLEVQLPPPPGDLSWGLTRTDTGIELTAASASCVAGPGDLDCNGNGIADACDFEYGLDVDCNGNGVPDACDIADETDPDCNGNGRPDSCDLADGSSVDCDGNGRPDECDSASVQQVLVPEPFDDGNFGDAVTIFGDHAVIGAPGYESNGAVFVFRREGATWVQDAMLMEVDPFLPPAYGADVELDGDLLAVGAPGASTVYVYRRIGDTWTLDQEIVDLGMIGFGSRVAASGDVVIGAGRTFGFDYGAATFFRYEGGKWQLDASFTMVDAPFESMQPATVAVDGDVAAVGVRGLGFGAIFIYRYDGSDWFEEEVLLPPVGLGFGHPIAGVPIALDGDTLVIGSIWNKSAFIYRYDGVAWNEEVVFPLTGQQINSFGKSVDVDGDLVGVRAQSSTLVYRREADGWRRIAVLATPAASATRSQDLGLEGSDVIAGSSTEDEAHAYDLEGPDCNRNGRIDGCDIADGTSVDSNANGVPDECECIGDLDGDGAIAFADLIALLFEWGPCLDCPSDLNGNGEVEFIDLLLLLDAWGPC